MRNLKLSLCVVLALLSLGAGAASASVLYSGQLTSADNGLLGTGSWYLTPGSPTTIDWTISDNGNGTYHYSYTLTPGGQGGISHIIIETSANFTSADITNANGAFVLGPWTAQNGSPGLPSNVFGLEFTTDNVSFDSDRLPVWGDFYAKDGNAGGMGTNAIWNAGFTNPENNPIGSPPTNGSLGFEILVPDTVNVPEPAAMGLLGIGLVSVFAFKRPRRK